MQGTRNTRRKTGNVSNVIDLDALLAKRLLKPVPTVLGGHTYQVRTDLTGAEITEYFSLTGEGKDVEALTLLVGADDAERLNTALADLPQAHMTLVVRKIMTSAGVIRGVPEDADEGSVGEGGILGVLALVLTTGWDALSADFERYYQRDLRDAFVTMPAVDLVARIQKLPPGSAFARQEMGDCADWGLHEENTARLFDLANWYIQTIWMDRITDPDDPDIKAEQQRAKRAGIKPPESPLIPPVAHRPPSLQDSQIAEFKQLAERYKVPPKLKIGEADPMDLLMQWNRMIGIA